jgi:uncharacterized protein
MGRPVMHWEFWSKQPEKVADFYAKVFDWKIEHQPEMNYRFVTTGEGGTNGGIINPEREGPWPGNMALYIDVDDLEKYVRKVKDAGGKIHVERQDVPGAGSFSLFEDPDGRVNALWLQTKKKE